jgi:hypothetical protein
VVLFVTKKCVDNEDGGLVSLRVCTMTTCSLQPGFCTLGTSHVLLKVDISRAFDSVAWPFLSFWS